MKRLLLFILPTLLFATPVSTQTVVKGKVLVIVSSQDAMVKNIELATS